MPTYTLSGRGIRTLSGGLAGLHVHQTLTTVDATIGSANPANFYKAGELRLGNAYGWREVRFLDALDVWMDVPPGTTRLGYAIGDGGEVTVEEVAAPAVLSSSLMPWDRNPSAVQFAAINAMAGGTARQTWWTYTVPAGRKLWIASANVFMQRYAPATGGAVIVEALIRISSQYAVYVAQTATAVGATAHDALTGPQVVGAGTVIDAQANNADSGGIWYISLLLSGFTFDA